MTDTHDIVLKVYEHFKKRSDTLGYKGKKRLDYLVEFFAGAATAYIGTEHENSFLFNFTMLCIRGEEWLKDMEKVDA